MAPQLFRALGCEVTELFYEVDGTFNHHPDPAELKNLRDLIKCVAETDCELAWQVRRRTATAWAWSQPGHHLADRQLVLFACDVLDRNPGATIIYAAYGPVRASRGRCAADVETGHSVKAKLAETGASLAGEMSGHIFFGRHDGLYTGAFAGNRARAKPMPARPLEALVPQDVSTPELKLEWKKASRTRW